MPDKTIACKNYGKPFVFSEREQELFASRTDERSGKPWGDPVRCRPCRDIKKQSRPKQDQQTG